MQSDSSLNAIAMERVNPYGVWTMVTRARRWPAKQPASEGCGGGAAPPAKQPTAKSKEKITQSNGSRNTILIDKDGEQFEELNADENPNSLGKKSSEDKAIMKDNPERSGMRAKYGNSCSIKDKDQVKIRVAASKESLLASLRLTKEAKAATAH